MHDCEGPGMEFSYQVAKSAAGVAEQLVQRPVRVAFDLGKVLGL